MEIQYNKMNLYDEMLHNKIFGNGSTKETLPDKDLQDILLNIKFPTLRSELIEALDLSEILVDTNIFNTEGQLETTQIVKSREQIIKSTEDVDNWVNENEYPESLPDLTEETKIIIQPNASLALSDVDIQSFGTLNLTEEVQRNNDENKIEKNIKTLKSEQEEKYQNKIGEFRNIEIMEEQNNEMTESFDKNSDLDKINLTQKPIQEQTINGEEDFVKPLITPSEVIECLPMEKFIKILPKLIPASLIINLANMSRKQTKEELEEMEKKYPWMKDLDFGKYRYTSISTKEKLIFGTICIKYKENFEVNPSIRQMNTPKPITCFNCNRRGHKKSICNMCPKCHEFGHAEMHCKKPSCRHWTMNGCARCSSPSCTRFPKAYCEIQMRQRCGRCMKFNHSDAQCLLYTVIPRINKLPEFILRQPNKIGSHCDNHGRYTIRDMHWSSECPEFELVRKWNNNGKENGLRYGVKNQFRRQIQRTEL